MMRDENAGADASETRPDGSGDLAFAAFSLTHTLCEEGAIEVRLGEGVLLACCPRCSVVEVFVSLR